MVGNPFSRRDDPLHPLLVALQAGVIAFFVHMSWDWDWDMAAIGTLAFVFIAVVTSYRTTRAADLRRSARRARHVAETGGGRRPSEQSRPRRRRGCGRRPTRRSQPDGRSSAASRDEPAAAADDGGAAPARSAERAVE